jgi:glycosyltransferase involved in cell wall biosynthesis
MEGKGKTVCMISCLHPLKDDRIYWKESISLQKHGYKVVHIGVSDNSNDYISEHGIRLISLKRKQYFKNPFIDKFFRTITFRPNIYSEILKTAATINADVYHFHDYQINRIGKKLKSLPQKPKVIYDVHEPYPVTVSTTDSQNPFKRLFWRIYGLYVQYFEFSNSKYYDLIITTEENVQQRFQTHLKNIPIEIIYNYIDIEPGNNSLQKKYDFIYCGGIRKRRGIYEILKACTFLKNKGLKFNTILIGHIHDNGLEEEIMNFIASNQLTDCIELKPAVSYEEIVRYYESSRIGLAIFNDNKVNRIIMPIKIFEYIVFGLPVITSNLGHMYDITSTHKTGLTINPNSVQELASAMEKLINDKNLFNSLSENCQRAAIQFKWVHMENKLIQIYNNLVS